MTDPQPDPPGTAIPTESTTQQSRPSMEVHHHGHIHEQKKWKEYVFQFIMLFLAVFLGFLTENLREHLEQKKLEREYIGSLAVDLEMDHLVINTTLKQITAQIHGFDSLQNLFETADLNNDANAVYKCYYYTSYLQLSFPVNFNERTITQLLSTGNMRLLKTRAAADSVTDYFNLIKDVETQKQMYVSNINKCTEQMYNVYDISYLRRTVDSNDSLVFVNNDWSKIRLLSTDPGEIRKLMATMEVTKLLIHGYKLYLEMIDERCAQLLDFLDKQYHLKD